MIENNNVPPFYHSMKNYAIPLWSSMSRFIKFIPSEEAFWLMRYKPNAFRLLSHIANTARRTNGHPDGLSIGQCHLQRWTFYGFTERQYRTAKSILEQRKHIQIIETNRKRQKSTAGTTTASTLVQICSDTIYDINLNSCDDRNDDRATTDRRQTRMKKNEKEDHPSIPSFRNELMTDDFSFEREKIEIGGGVFMSREDLEACIKIKGDLDSVKRAVEFIQSSKKRKHPIEDWPNALTKWKIDNKPQNRAREHISYSDKLCEEFAQFQNGHGWRCRVYRDTKKDQQGILFESSSAYQEAFFVPFVDGEFQNKCDDFIKSKNMRQFREIIR